MVKATKGVLVTCDPAVKQILLQLDDSGRERFLIKELDDTHVLISAEHLTRIKEELQVELEKNNYVALNT